MQPLCIEHRRHRRSATGSGSLGRSRETGFRTRMGVFNRSSCAWLQARAESTRCQSPWPALRCEESTMTDHQMSRRSALVGIGGTAVGAALSTSLLAMPAAAATTAQQAPPVVAPTVRAPANGRIRATAQQDDVGGEARSAATAEHAGAGREIVGDRSTLRRSLLRGWRCETQRAPTAVCPAHAPAHPADFRPGRHSRVHHQLSRSRWAKPPASTPAVAKTDAVVSAAEAQAQRHHLDLRADDGRHPRTTLGTDRRG